MCIYKLDGGRRCITDISGNTEELSAKFHRLFAYVPQGNQLMSGTIREVVCFADKSELHNDERISEALKIACAEEFVSELDDGVDTLLGERGTGLSEGQMQRIAIARAIYSRCPILLLDEATSALDEATERKVLENLKNMTDKTVVIVTHRPAALDICDRILQFTENGVIDNGKSEFRKNAADMIYLTACAINDRTPRQERVERLELPNLFEVSQKHILTACVAYALESAGVKDNDFTQAKEKAIRKNILLDAERGNILRKLEAEKIWYMPLKGSILKDWYPKLGMRQMSDNDILCDSKKMAEVRDIFLDEGYECEHFGQGNHDVYFKEPVLNFEMHSDLFSPTHIGNLYPYFKDIKERLIPDENSDHGYHFRNEDFYLFMLAHEYKHFTGGGTGVRSLVDTYIFLRRFSKSLNWDYLGEELEKLGITDFERSNRELAKKVFLLKPLTTENKELLDYYVLSGTYGNDSNLVSNGVKFRGNGSKFRYLMYLFFPPVSFLENSVPWVKKNKLLIPAAYMYRFLHGATVNRKKVGSEFRYLGKK